MYKVTLAIKWERIHKKQLQVRLTEQLKFLNKLLSKTLSPSPSQIGRGSAQASCCTDPLGLVFYDSVPPSPISLSLIPK